MTFKIKKISTPKIKSPILIEGLPGMGNVGKIELYYKNIKNQSFIFLSGDIQPIEETSCYEFCEIVLDIFEKFKGKEIITVGGIGMPEQPLHPKVFSTANNKEIIKKYKNKNVNSQLYGIVGPIIGVSGLLLGLSKERKIPAISFLAETFGHPAYLGVKGAKEILKNLNQDLKLNLNLKILDKEIEEIEKEQNPEKIKKYKPKFSDGTHLN